MSLERKISSSLPQDRAAATAAAVLAVSFQVVSKVRKLFFFFNNWKVGGAPTSPVVFNSLSS